MVVMEGECLLDIAHECGLAYVGIGEGVTSYEGDYAAGKEPVVALQWDELCAWVV